MFSHILKKNLFVAFPWVETSTGPGGFTFVCLLYNGNSRRLNRKWFYGEAGIRTCDPWFTRHSAYPLHHGASLVIYFGDSQFRRNGIFSFIISKMYDDKRLRVR